MVENRLVYEFEDGSIVEYRRGGFDDWKVEYTAGMNAGFGGSRALRDYEYFKNVKLYADKIGNKIVLDDLKKIFELIQKNAEQNFGNPEPTAEELSIIEQFSKKYEVTFGLNSLKHLLFYMPL